MHRTEHQEARSSLTAQTLLPQCCLEAGSQLAKVQAEQRLGGQGGGDRAPKTLRVLPGSPASVKRRVRPRPLAGPEALAAEDLTACVIQKGAPWKGELDSSTDGLRPMPHRRQSTLMLLGGSFFPRLPGSSIGRGCAQRPRRATRREQRCGRGTAGIFVLVLDASDGLMPGVLLSPCPSFLALRAGFPPSLSLAHALLTLGVSRQSCNAFQSWKCSSRLAAQTVIHNLL